MSLIYTQLLSRGDHLDYITTLNMPNFVKFCQIIVYSKCDLLNMHYNKGYEVNVVNTDAYNK